MARVLALSSWTCAGHVGLSAAVPALQSLGHTVTQLPTIILSNAPGFPRVAGERVPPRQLAAMIDALDGNGWLAGHDAALTGYLPSEAHVDIAVDLVGRLRRLPAPPRIFVDPILGDTAEGLYLDPAAAAALRDRLVPLADVLTPNAFELGWLAELPVATLAEAARAARTLGPDVVVTSPPLRGATGVLHVGRAVATLHRSHRYPGVPHGVGDVFVALLAAGLSVGEAVGHLAALAAASTGLEHLALVPASGWVSAAPIPGLPIAET